MTNIIVDIEADGPVPGLYSMVSFGAVILDRKLDKTFYGQVKPVTETWIPEALAVSGHSREETMTFREPDVVMLEFNDWILANTPKGQRPHFWADNNGFDFAFINYYFHAYMGDNPFGWSSRNINDLHKGLRKKMSARLGKLKKTKHTHHPVDDAMGCAEALLTLNDQYFLKLV